MLLQYRLSDEARLRQFQEGQAQSTSQLLELDISHFSAASQARIRSLGHLKGTAVDPISGVMRSVVEFDGVWDALTIEEFLAELARRTEPALAVPKERREVEKKPEHIPPPRWVR